MSARAVLAPILRSALHSTSRTGFSVMRNSLSTLARSGSPGFVHVVPFRVVGIPRSFGRFASTEATSAAMTAAAVAPDVTRIEQLKAELATLEAAAAAKAAEVAPVVSSSDAIGAAYSPIAGVQYVIDWIHTAGGLPWWVSIMAATVMIRTTLLPITLRVLRNTRKLSNMQPELKVVQDQIAQAKASGDQHALMKAADDMRGLFAKHDASPWKSFMSIFTMAPLYICFFVGLRRMATHADLWPGFKEGGLAWFSDLSASDPYYILPTFSALTMLATMELGSDGMKMDQYGSIMKNAMRAMALITIPFGGQFPAAVLVYWSTSNVFSILQTALLKIPGLRKLLNIPEMIARPRDGAVPTNFTLEKPAVTFTQRPKQAKKDDADATETNKQ